MRKFILIDASNLFFRIKHTSGIHIDPDTKASLGIHMVLTSMRNIWKKFEGDHLVWCLEGHSWRKKYSSLYKKTRQTKLDLRTQSEKDQDDVYFEAMHDFNNFLKERTNVTVLQGEGLEADDCIAGWIRYHPDDFHVVLSGDSDFYQLLAENVVLYDGIQNHLTTIDGVYDDKGNPVLDKKTGLATVLDPEYELFKKIIRGDTSDCIPSCYPSIREKGSLKKPGIKEAFNDRFDKGCHWNNFMQHEWEDEDDSGRKFKVKVSERYDLNKLLIDLKEQPEEIKLILNDVIETAITHPPKPMIGIWLLKLSGKYSLAQIAKTPHDYSCILSATYNGRK